METPSADDLAKWHRFFAVEANNEAWQRTLDEVGHRDSLGILQQAYVSAYHWSCCGTDRNTFRADMLLAHAHSFCGHGQTALEYVSRYRSYLSGNEVEAWETVFAVMIHAQAAWAAGDHDLHVQMYAEAAALIELVADPNDREIIIGTWVNIQRP